MVDRLACISIPLTLNSVLLKTTVHSAPSLVHDLSNIFRAMEIMADRHEVGDWFLNLNDACLQFVHDTMSQESALRKPESAIRTHRNRDLNQSAAKAVQPASYLDAYCQVLKFQNQAFACGRIKMVSDDSVLPAERFSHCNVLR